MSSFSLVSSSSRPPPPPPPPPRLGHYDVFLSFRGEDIRNSFVSHLCNAFRKKKIVTFIDNPEIQLGDDIFQTIIKALRNSKIAVVVISNNYATSSWCLEELRLIMELEEENKIEVIPIFYRVNISHVRYQQEDFNLQTYHNHRNADKIPDWNNALKRIAGFNGKDSANLRENEADMIEDIVKLILWKLKPKMATNLGGDIIGVEEYMKDINDLLKKEPINKARMLGICGIEGIGKTTIATYLYEKHKPQFSSHHFFMEKIGSFVKTPNDLFHLQKKLIYKILGENHLDLSTMEGAARYIMSEFKNLKILLVLDDVNDLDHLHCLAREATWFGPGSLIIITTRRRKFLTFNRVSCVYNVKCLDDEKTLQLFKATAFEGTYPPISPLFDDLSRRVSRLALGLPSAIIHYGLWLRDKPLEEWEDDVISFEKDSRDTRERILKTEYDNLDEDHKIVFLYVACLFNGDSLQRVKHLCYRGAARIEDSELKSLIHISSDGLIAMPAMVEQMGKRIVRQRRGSDNNPSNQRILWQHPDIIEVIADNSGTRNNEGVSADAGQIPECLKIRWDVFRKMHNLFFLKIYNNFESFKDGLILQGDLYVPCNIRLLDWASYPFTTLPSLILQQSLVELNLCHSKLTTLSNQTSKLLHLRRLDLTESKYLKQLPDLQEAEYLEELMLSGCSALKEIPNSICSLPRLQKLDVSNCKGLKNLHITIRESETTVFQEFLRIRSLKLALADAEPPQGISLTNLSIKGNLNIMFPQVLEGYAEHLCFVSEEQHMPKFLDIMRFNYVEKSDDNFKCHSLSGFPWLKELNLINLNIQEIRDISQMQALEKLDLSGNDFKNLPSTMSDLMKLKHLTLCNCRKLKELPELYQLETLILSDCTKLTTLVTPLYQGAYNLLELWLDNCRNVENLSDQLTRFQKLRYLDISRQDFESVPTSINNLSSLVTLCLNFCKNLKSITELPQSLKCLKTHGCNSLETLSSSTDTCLHPTQNPSKITRFPVGRRGREVPMCGCFKNSIVRRRIKRPNYIPIIWQRLMPYLCGFGIAIIIVGLHAILRVAGLDDPFSSTTTDFHIYLLALVAAIIVYRLL